MILLLFLLWIELSISQFKYDFYFFFFQNFIDFYFFFFLFLFLIFFFFFFFFQFLIETKLWAAFGGVSIPFITSILESSSVPLSLPLNFLPPSPPPLSSHLPPPPPRSYNSTKQKQWFAQISNSIEPPLFFVTFPLSLPPK